MNGILYLAWRYLSFHRWKTVILVSAIALVMYLPAAIQALIDQTAERLNTRAETTPYLVGALGSPLELALNSLYFHAAPPPRLNYTEISHMRDEALARPIPLYVRFQSRGIPIVGTSPAYFEYRNLAISEGRAIAMLGEALLGAKAAKQLGVGVGDYVLSSPENVFDLAGVYPLKMPVVGILGAKATPDDEAIFVDIKTTWVIEGLGHGHQDLQTPTASATILKQEEDNIVANASVVQYNEITNDNIDSFHFHGNTNQYPLTAVIAAPTDDKSAVILMGRYEGREDNVQMQQPPQVMTELMDTIFTVRTYVIAAMLLLGLATTLVAVLVFLLSLRLRRNEFQTMARIGGSRWGVALLSGSEILLVLVTSSIVALILTLLTRAFGGPLIEAYIVS